MYDKEHGRFHDRHRKEALWAEISAELKLQPFDVRRWFESQRTRYGKLSKLQSGQAPREMTKRQSWVCLRPLSDARGPTEVLRLRPVSTPASMKNRMALLLIQNILVRSSVLRESASQPIITSTPVSTDSKILKHFDQMRTLISGFLQQKSGRQPFFD